MRELLKKAIEINPSFTESYELLAFVSVVTNENIDEGIAAMLKALKYQPGNQGYALRIAELYSRQDKFEQAAALAGRISKTTDDPEIKSRADSLISQIKTRTEIMARNEEARKQYEAAIAAGAKDGGGRQPYLIRRTADGREPSPEEVKRQAEDFEVRAINGELRKPEPTEVRLLGRLEKIECKAGKITYTVISDSETFTLGSKDFQGLSLASYVVEAGNAEIGCDAKPTLKAVLTYKPQTAPKAVTRGELVSVEFVPAHFRLIDLTAAAEPPPAAAEVTTTDAAPAEVLNVSAPGAAPDFDEMRRNSMLQQIRQAMRKPAPGETRVMGFIEKSECNSKGAFFFVKTQSGVLKLNGGPNTKPEMRAFTPDVENLQIGCGMKAVEIPVVITYREAFDKKTKANGDMIAIEFVPKSFVLEQ